MSPDALASLLDANPYPGCVAAHFTDADTVGLDFDGLILRYQRDGWHFGDAHLESTLSEHSAPEQVHPEIRRILKVVMSLKVGRALGEAETLRSEDPVEYLTDLAAEKMLAILDVAALANARKAEIASNVAEAAAREMRIAELERDLAAKDKSLTTAHAALTRICEVIGAPVPCVAEDAVEAVKTLRGASEHAEARVRETEATMREIGLALEDAGAPAVYHLDDDTERPIPDPERIRLLGERVRGEHAERIREGDRARLYLDRIFAAEQELDAIGSPRHTDGPMLSLSARIRALPTTRKTAPCPTCICSPCGCAE